MPKSNVAFWEAKFARNAARDAEYEEKLRIDGWKVLVIWECQTADPDQLKTLLKDHFRLTIRF